MGEVVNLRRARKRKQRDEEGRAAAENRAQFGRTKVEKTRDDGAKDRARRKLDQHKLTEE